MATARGLGLALLLCLAGPAVAAQDLCRKQPFWKGDRFVGPTGKDWSSYGLTSWFQAGPCVQVSGIGTTETPQKTVYIIDRTDYINTYMKEARGNLAFAQEVNLVTGQQRALNVITNAFCSTGGYTRDGKFLNIGGGKPNPGGFSVREITPCSDGRCDFSIAGRIRTWRWYPTSERMPDGRMIVVGGSLNGADLNYRAIDNPTLEYYPAKRGESSVRLQFLADALPFNLYPFVHLLPSGLVWIFAANMYILFDPSRNRQVGDPRYLYVEDANGSPIYRQYPVPGTSMLFPLSPRNGFAAEIMICGGNSESAKPKPGKEGNTGVVADKRCYSILPEQKDPQWGTFEMQAPRVMLNAVLLPNGKVLLINGAETGYAGTPNWAHKPVLQPEMFDPDTHTFNGRALASSNIPRTYHASALLLHDATVLLSGSNPNTGINLKAEEFPSEFRTEFFFPPYHFRGGNPSITAAPGKVGLGKVFQIQFSGKAKAQQVKVVLAYPGFSTHGENHGMRNVELELMDITGNGKYTANVKSPPSYNIAPPGWYWLFVVVDDKPNRDGRAITIT